MHKFQVTFKEGYLSSGQKPKRPAFVMADDFTLEKSGNEWGWFLFSKDGEAVAQFQAYEVASVVRVDAEVEAPDGCYAGT